MELPYKHLTLFVIGTLIGVVIVGICTENFLSSSGFEYRKGVFCCLVNHLEEQNVTDDYFDVAKSYNVSTDECIQVFKEFDVLTTLKSNFYSPYNVSIEWCESPLCKRSENETKSESNHCFELKSLSENPKNESAADVYSQGKKRCDELDVCFNCVKENLASFSDYEQIKLHAVALNFTIIEFRVWNYFTISERVLTLANEAHKMELDAVNKCKDRKICTENIEV